MATIRIENAYTDGHGSTSTVTVDDPEGDMDEWWEETVWPHTGDGHNLSHPHTESHYQATILDGPHIGAVKEWC